MCYRLVYENKPRNLILSQRFKAMMTLPGYEYTPIARKTFLKMLYEEFNTFIKLVQETLYKAQKGSYGRPFLHVVYDM